jgi:hypothetical protein
MDDYDEDFPQFVGTLAEFDEVQVATPDRDGPARWRRFRLPSVTA